MFQGFDDATVDFMWGIRFNNNRDWFGQHKQEYLDHFHRPMAELECQVYEHLAPQLKEYELKGKVSRIYRDARRLFGRGPFKDHLWLSVERPGEVESPCFWFELAPEGWSYGVGYWEATPRTMAKLRQRIRREPEKMERLTRALAAQEEFSLEGRVYQRPKAGAPNETLAPWFALRSVVLAHREELTEELFHPELAERLLSGFDFLVPYFRYLASLPGEPEPESLR